MPMKTLTLAATCALLLIGCASDGSNNPTVRTVAAAHNPGDAVTVIQAYPSDTGFEDYWYQGKAEITSYNLEQPRYGETRAGKAVLIFVTEDFSRRKHVKLDDYTRAGDDKVTVLKLNRTHKFNTGIYPYSMMSSVFTPVSGDRDPHTLKVTTSSQEWCGHTFVQFDLIEDGYRVQHHSYFESSADQTIELSNAILEDEIWTKIRINPLSLPSGDIRIVAGTFYQRLSHNAYAVENALASLDPMDDTEYAYTLSFEHRARTLTIRFEQAFPHRITGWEESYTRGNGADARLVTTRATRDKSMLLDYWTRNSLADEALRAELNLD